MTVNEYLNQTQHLGALINCRLREVDYWRDLSSSVSDNNFDLHYNPNKPTEVRRINGMAFRISPLQKSNKSVS